MNTIALSSSPASGSQPQIDLPQIGRSAGLLSEKTYYFEKGKGLAERLGYGSGILSSLPVQAVDSFKGAGYYFDLADLQKGEKVVALGGSPVMDAFFAATQVGPDGYVTAIDCLDEKLNNANSLVFVYQLNNILFRKGRSENIPEPDQGTDVVISNNTIHLSPDKESLFRETARILRHRGRFALAEIISERALPRQTEIDAKEPLDGMHRILQRDELMNCIENTGLQIQKVNYNHQLHFLPESITKYAEKSGLSAISLLAYKV